MSKQVAFIQGNNFLYIPKEVGTTNTLLFKCQLRESTTAEYTYNEPFTYELVNDDSDSTVTLETIQHPVYDTVGKLTITDQTPENTHVWVVVKWQTDPTVKTDAHVKFFFEPEIDPNAKAPVEMRVDELTENVDLISIALDDLILNSL